MKAFVLTLTAATVTLASCHPATQSVPPANPPPPILSRAAWDAKPPVADMKPHTPVRITIHHTATRQNPDRPLDDKLRALQRFSQREDKLASGRIKPAWPDVPYHYYIDCTGAVGEGRTLEFAGDTNTEYDPTGHALVVLEGNFEEEEMTEAQLDSLLHITVWLARTWNVPPENIGGHSDYARTACPGKSLHAHLPELRRQVAEALK